MTFLVAGHETTSAATSWALHYLSTNQEAQSKLRKEIVKEFPDKDFVPTFEQINSLDYLNAVCKETLRLSSPGVKICFFFSSPQLIMIFVVFVFNIFIYIYIYIFLYIHSSNFIS